MARYINAKQLANRFLSMNKEKLRIGTIINEIEIAERGLSRIVDVEEVQHGHWIRINNKRACSECGYYYFSNGVDANYCSECGAKMDRGNLSIIPTDCERRDT